MKTSELGGLQLYNTNSSKRVFICQATGQMTLIPLRRRGQGSRAKHYMMKKSDVKAMNSSFNAIRQAMS